MKSISDLTIIIPYYKKAFFYFTLLSLEKQSYKNFEIFIGDDNSSQDPMPIINLFKNNLSIIYRKFDQNLGQKSLTSHWTRCIKFAPKTKWIMILGDDDMLSRNCISDFHKEINKIKDGKIKVIRFSSQIIDVDNKKISKVHTHKYLENSFSFLFRKIQGTERSSLSEHIFDRQSLDQIGFKDFPLAWHSDDLALIETSNCGNILSINGSIAYIRSSEINISGNSLFAKKKNLASYHFYKHLLIKYHKLLTPYKRGKLLSKLEKCVVNNRMNFFLLRDITIYFLQNSYYKRYLLFVIKFFKIW